MHKKNILITGATGFIGSHVAHTLLSEKHKLYITLRENSDMWRIMDILPHVSVCTINTPQEIETILTRSKIDTIINLSTCYYRHHTTLKHIEEMNYANITFPTLLLELALKNGVTSFINTGSCFEYKESKNNITETSTISANNYYASTKLAFEEILKYYSNFYQLRAITLKLFYPYGEKDNKKIIPLLLGSAIKDEQIGVTKGEQKLNFTYVQDIADAFEKAVTYIDSKNYTEYETINIGAEKNPSVRELVDIIAMISKKTPRIKFGALPYSAHEIMSMKCTGEKAKKLLNWYPKTTIEIGLKKTYEYYFTHPERLF